MTLIETDFYTGKDVVWIARALLGTLIWVQGYDQIITVSRIVETEAYSHKNDRASHAFQSRCTPRNKSMFARGGTSYVYVCYGIHHMLNIVSNEAGVPDAILIRAVEPITGFEQMAKRRGLAVEKNPKITSGPGKLTKALAIDKTYDGECLLSGRIRLFTDDFLLKSEMIVAAPRIGVEYAGADALLPWRFYLCDNKFVSRRS